MDEIKKKIDELIVAHETLVRSNGNNEIVVSNYNKIAQLNLIKQEITNYENMK